MASITISRQHGSLGLDVARLTAERLGFRLVHRELINQAARQAGDPGLALAAIDDLGLFGMRPTRKASQAYLEAINRLMAEYADRGNYVIVGRAGQAILAGHPQVLHVRIVAPAAVRVENIARKHQISLEGARAQIESSDRRRRGYLRRYYHIQWDNPDLYHLILNTGRLSVETAGKLICSAMENLLEEKPIQTKGP